MLINIDEVDILISLFNKQKHLKNSEYKLYEKLLKTKELNNE